MDEISTTLETIPAHLVPAIVTYLVLLGAGILTAILIAVRYSFHPVAPKPLTDRLTNRSWDSFAIGMLLALLISGFLLMQLWSMLFSSAPGITAGAAKTGLIYGAALLLIATHIKRRGENWDAAFGLSLRKLPAGIATALPYYLATIPAVLFLTAPYHTLLKKAGIEVDMQAVAKLFTQEHALPEKTILILLAVVIAPFFEELLFRGILLPYFAKRAGIPRAILATSLLFALIHFHLPVAMPLFVLSAALGAAYWRTGSLWTCMGMHSLFNGISISVLMLSKMS